MRGLKLEVVWTFPANALKRKRDNSDSNKSSDLKFLPRITNPMNVTVVTPDDTSIETVIHNTTTVALILYELRENKHLPKGTKCQITWKGDELDLSYAGEKSCSSSMNERETQGEERSADGTQKTTQ